MAGLSPQSSGLLGAIPTETPKVDQHVDYHNLPCPIPYEEIHREALMSLKPEVFEGARFDFTKALSPNFYLTHSATMGNSEIPAQSPEPLKTPSANYEFGATYIAPELMLAGRLSHDGKLNARLKYDLMDNLALKGSANLTSEPHMSHAMGSLDYKGKDFRTQLQFGTGALLGASYIQSVTPNLALGGEIFYAGQHRKSGTGFAARYNSDKMTATGQVATTGMVALSYSQKASEKVSFATELMYNYMSRDVTASVGYDAMFRQARVRGKIDNNGVATAFLEERLSPGLGFLLSAELDHWKKDYRFGFGMTVGE